MIMAARALVRNQFLDVGDDPNRIVQEFKTRFVETQLFFDRYAKGKFARYLLDRHENPPVTATKDSVRKLVGETNLFIEACHSCDARLAGALAGGVSL
jgi:sulfite reductase (ferredoxin)